MEDNSTYSRIFKDTAKDTEKAEKKVKKEKKFIFAFLMQSIVCVLIIASVIIVKYATPKKFISVSEVITGLYEENVTLKDLSYMIENFISENDALTTFFNINP